jgi:hypothetical protein
MGPWIAELRTCWEYGRQIASTSRVVVDLSDVTFIDESGETLLSEMKNSGAEFVGAGVATAHLLENLKIKGERPLRRFVAPMGNCWEGPARRCGNKDQNE